jgi:hypothetical protein
LKNLCQHKRRIRRNISQLSSILNEDNFGGAGGGGGGTYGIVISSYRIYNFYSLMT